MKAVGSSPVKSIVAPLPGQFGLVGGMSFKSPQAFDKFVASHKTLRLRPGESFTIRFPSRQAFSYLRGLNKDSPFTIKASKDIPTSYVTVTAKTKQKPGASDNLRLETFKKRDTALPTPDLKTRFKLEVSYIVF
jgi:hypothetical protein